MAEVFDEFGYQHLVAQNYCINCGTANFRSDHDYDDHLVVAEMANSLWYATYVAAHTTEFGEIEFDELTGFFNN